MVPPTRRRVLQAAAGLALALPGCNELLDGTAESTRTPTANGAVAAGPYSGSDTDPALVALRTDEERPPIWLADPDEGDADRPTPDDMHRLIGGTVIDTRARADRISIADGSAAERARTFLAETDFDSQTIYLDTNRVEACFTLELCRIAWQPNHVETDYGRVLRPYDERCEADEQVYEARLIRIPEPLDSDNVNRYSSSTGSGACDREVPRPDDSEGSDAERSSLTTSSGSPTTTPTDPASGGGQ